MGTRRPDGVKENCCPVISDPVLNPQGCAWRNWLYSLCLEMENVSLSQLASWLISMLDLFFSHIFIAISPSSYPSIFSFFHFIKNTQQYKTFASFSFLGIHNQDKCKMPFLRLY